MKKRKKTKRDEPPAGIPEAPRPVPDVEIPPMDPNLWGGQPTGTTKKPTSP